MKLTFSDYFIGVLFTIPIFFVSFYGLSALSNLNTPTISIISILIWISDYSNHINYVRNDIIMNQMQKKIDELSKKQ